MALPTLPFTTNCSDFHVPFVPLLLFLQLVWNYPVTLCLIYTSSQFIPGSKRGSPKFLFYLFTILPWPQTPPKFVSTKTVIIVLKTAVFPRMKKVDLKIYLLFQGSIPSLALRPDCSLPPASHSLLPFYVESSVQLRWLNFKSAGFQPARYIVTAKRNVKFDNKRIYDLLAA